MFANSEELLRYLKDEGVKFVDVRFCDLPGIMQHFTVPAESVDESFFVNGVAKGTSFSATLAAGQSVEERLTGETFIQSVGLRCSTAQNFASSPLVVKVDTLLPDGTNYSPGTFTITDSCSAGGEVTLPIRNSVTDRVVVTVLSGQIAANNVRSYAFDCMYPNWPSTGSCEIN